MMHTGVHREASCSHDSTCWAAELERERLETYLWMCSARKTCSFLEPLWAWCSCKLYLEDNSVIKRGTISISWIIKKHLGHIDRDFRDYNFITSKVIPLATEALTTLSLQSGVVKISVSINFSACGWKVSGLWCSWFCSYLLIGHSVNVIWGGWVGEIELKLSRDTSYIMNGYY